MVLVFEQNAVENWSPAVQWSITLNGFKNISIFRQGSKNPVNQSFFVTRNHPRTKNSDQTEFSSGLPLPHDRPAGFSELFIYLFHGLFQDFSKSKLRFSRTAICGKRYFRSLYHHLSLKENTQLSSHTCF